MTAAKTRLLAGVRWLCCGKKRAGGIMVEGKAVLGIGRIILTHSELLAGRVFSGGAYGAGLRLLIH